MAYISEPSTVQLAKGKNPTQDKVFDLLDKLKIPYVCVENDPLSSMEECKAVDSVLETEVRKTIFLTNQKGTSFFLLVVPAEKQMDTDALAAKIGVKKLSFATEEQMVRHLGCHPGSASVMATINDEDDYIQVIFDKEVAQAEWFGCNPGINTAHLKLKTEDVLKKYLPKIWHKAKIMEL